MKKINNLAEYYNLPNTENNKNNILILNGVSSLFNNLSTPFTLSSLIKYFTFSASMITSA